MTKIKLWELDFKTFSKKVKTIRSPQYGDDYFTLGKRHQIGCHYYIFLDDNIGIINPYTKKDDGKKVFKRFVSTISREDVLEQAYNFIVDYAQKEGLYDINTTETLITSLYNR